MKIVIYSDDDEVMGNFEADQIDSDYLKTGGSLVIIIGDYDGLNINTWQIDGI